MSATRETRWGEEVQEFLEAHPRRSFKVKELSRALGIPHGHYRQFRSTVLDLAREGRIASLPRRRFQAPGGAGQVEGTVEGVGTRPTHVRLADGEQLPLWSSSLELVVPGDRVRVKRLRDAGQQLGRVERVLRAAPRTIFGTLAEHGGRWLLEPDHPVPGFRGAVFLADGAQPDREARGMLARATLPAFDPQTTRPLLERVDILGPADHPRAAMEALIEGRGWPRRFGEQAREQAASPPADLRPRVDLRDDLVFTIDPHDAKDHDDAVEVAALDGGGFRLRVHIADVASAVPEGSELDDEALERATSVYPPGQVLPMLPEQLSAGDCSLHHGVDRRCVTAEMRYDARGRRTGVAIGRTTIRSRASLSYRDAEAFLEDDGHEPEAGRIQSGVDRGELVGAVRRMLALAQRLRERRRELGSLFIERPERRYEFGDDGHVSGLALREPLRSHWIIEEFMLEANRAVAETLHAAELPLLWRVHEDPDERKVEELAELVRRMGVRWRPREPITGHDYADLFARLEGHPAAALLHLMSLRSLMKAKYRAGWGGHFGLAFGKYTHFTSPIRRYPDLHNQRWLHELLDAAGEGGWLDDAPARASRVKGRKLASEAHHRDARQLADHCSDMEYEASLIERDCGDICAADYLRPQVGQEFDGMVVSVVKSGLFVELDGLGIDGFVGLEELPHDWYDYDERRHAHVGSRSGRRFGLGQRVRVLLEAVDVRMGRIRLGQARPLEGRVATEGER